MDKEWFCDIQEANFHIIDSIKKTWTRPDENGRFMQASRNVTHRNDQTTDRIMDRITDWIMDQITEEKKKF